MIATSGCLPAFDCTKFVFGRGSAAEPAGVAYCSPLAALRGTLLLRERGGEGNEGKVGERKGKERRQSCPPPMANSWIRPCYFLNYNTIGLFLLTVM